jgi:hypothetical protein
MSRTRKLNGIPGFCGGAWWRGARWWKYYPGPPRWFRQVRNRMLRRRQDREVRQHEEIRTPRKRDVRWRWW